MGSGEEVCGPLAMKVSVRERESIIFLFIKFKLRSESVLYKQRKGFVCIIGKKNYYFFIIENHSSTTCGDKVEI